MLHLIERLLPAPLHRAALKVVHPLRKVVRRVLRPHVTGISLVGIDAQGHVLLVRHSYGAPRWMLPTGKVERGEEPSATARRELREELGCEADHLALVAAIDDDLWGAPHTDLVFTCELRSAPVPDGREVIEARFFPLDSLPEVSARTAKQLAVWREASG